MTQVYTTTWGRYEIVGDVVTEPAVIDEDGEVTKAAEVDSRCHVNAQGDVPESWGEPINPTVPMRVFNKGETVFYRFDTLEAFRAIEPQEDEDNEPTD